MTEINVLERLFSRAKSRQCLVLDCDKMAAAADGGVDGGCGASEAAEIASGRCNAALHSALHCEFRRIDALLQLGPERLYRGRRRLPDDVDRLGNFKSRI